MKNLVILLLSAIILVAGFSYFMTSGMDPCVRRDELYEEYSRPMTYAELSQKYENYTERFAARERGEIRLFEDEMSESVRRQYRTALYECQRSMQ